jgi:hypothetical protein
MYIVKTIEGMNGATVSYHRIVRITLEDGVAIAGVNGLAKVNGGPISFNTYEIPLAALIGPDFILSAANYLVSGDGHLVGGSIVSDEQTTLDSAKDRKWAEIKQARNEAEWAGAMTPKGKMDTTPDSQRKLGGYVQMALIAKLNGQPFNATWTMLDNTNQAHTADELIMAGVYVGTHVANMHECSQAIRMAIYAATTIEEVEAIQWPSDQ